MLTLIQKICDHLRLQKYLYRTVENQYYLLILAELVNLKEVQALWAPPNRMASKRLYQFLQGQGPHDIARRDRVTLDTVVKNLMQELYGRAHRQMDVYSFAIRYSVKDLFAYIPLMQERGYSHAQIQEQLLCSQEDIDRELSDTPQPHPTTNALVSKVRYFTPDTVLWDDLYRDLYQLAEFKTQHMPAYVISNAIPLTIHIKACLAAVDIILDDKNQNLKNLSI